MACRRTSLVGQLENRDFADSLLTKLSPVMHVPTFWESCLARTIIRLNAECVMRTPDRPSPRLCRKHKRLTPPEGWGRSVTDAAITTVAHRRTTAFAR